MQSFGGPFHSKILTCNLSWHWPNRRLYLKEVSSCYLFTETKYTLAKFPKYVIGSSLVEIVKIGNTKISSENYADRARDRGSDCEVRRAGKIRHQN